jgi:hypothetical protein
VIVLSTIFLSQVVVGLIGNYRLSWSAADSSFTLPVFFLCGSECGRRLSDNVNMRKYVRAPFVMPFLQTFHPCHFSSRQFAPRQASQTIYSRRPAKSIRHYPYLSHDNKRRCFLQDPGGIPPSRETTFHSVACCIWVCGSVSHVRGLSRTEAHSPFRA